MLAPMRSLTDEAGLKLSSLKAISATAPSDWGIRLSRTMGVWPMSSVMLLAMGIVDLLCETGG